MKNSRYLFNVKASAMIILLMLLAACAIAPTSTPGIAATQAPMRSPNAPPPTPTGKFLFTSQSMAQVNLADIESGNITPLTDNPDGSSCPAYSPDGARIAFCSQRAGANGLYTMASDGSDQQRLTDQISTCGCSPDARLSWSPDGQWIVLPVNDDPNSRANYDLFAVSTDGKQAINMTGAPQRYGGVLWNSDSQSVLFSGQVQGVNDIYQVKVKNQKITPLLNTALIGAATGWSPEGQLLLFADSGGGNFDIFVLKASDTTPVRLTDAAGSDDYPIWFPDGKQILFVSARDGNKELYRMAADGSGQTNLTNHPDAMDIWASLSPDGRKVVFLSVKNNQWSCWVMNSDGTNPRELTGLIGIAPTISWQ